MAVEVDIERHCTDSGPNENTDGNNPIRAAPAPVPTTSASASTYTRIRASFGSYSTSRRDSNNDTVKYRKGIRLISVVDFTMALVMLFLLSFGFFPVRRDAARDKSVQAFILGMYGLYSVQILVSVILYKGTHKINPEVVVRSFKQWSTTSNVLNVMLCAEVYFFILIVDGRTLISMVITTLCFLKVIFRGVAVQIVNYSIRELTAQHNLSSALFSPYTNSNNTGNSSSSGGELGGLLVDPRTCKPPPAYEYPPKYEEAIKMCDLLKNEEQEEIKHTTNSN